jgi:hypothetical protein
MDPKLSNLDPKLADAYNRVMNGPTTTTSPQNPPIPSAPSSVLPPPQPVQMPTQTYSAPQPPPIQPDPISTQPVLPQQPVDSFQPTAQTAFTQPPSEMAQSAPFQDTVSSQAPVQTTSSQGYATNTIPGVNTTLAFNASNEGKNQGTTVVKKRGSHIMPVVVGMGIIMLLTVYTFVWIIVFNVQIPFLPQL